MLEPVIIDLEDPSPADISQFACDQLCFICSMYIVTKKIPLSWVRVFLKVLKREGRFPIFVNRRKNAKKTQQLGDRITLDESEG